MNIWVKTLFVFLFFSLIILPKITFAHPGNTAADGCHYCRTNCDKWGVAWNERHCHGESSSIKTNYSTPKETDSNFISDHPFVSMALAGCSGYGIYSLFKKNN